MSAESLILNHSNNFLIINNSKFKLYKIILHGVDEDGNNIEEVITDEVGYNISTLIQQGLVYERRQAFAIKYVSVFPWDFNDNNLSQECRFSQLSTSTLDLNTRRVFVRSQAVKIQDYPIDFKMSIDVFIRQLFVQPRQNDLDSCIILGIEISDKADFNTVFVS